jgi:hypothetical protein
MGDYYSAFVYDKGDHRDRAREIELHKNYAFIEFILCEEPHPRNDRWSVFSDYSTWSKIRDFILDYGSSSWQRQQVLSYDGTRRSIGYDKMIDGERVVTMPIAEDSWIGYYWWRDGKFCPNDLARIDAEVNRLLKRVVPDRVLIEFRQVY